MDIKLRHVSVRDLVEGYSDDDDGAVRGYRGRLDIRPPFQREFVYDDKQREAVIDSITENYPLNVMYWADREDAEGTFEIIDGQQRTISIAEYVNGVFSHNDKYFENLTKDEQSHIYDYKLMVYVCKGTDREKLNWFEIINIAGEKLLPQELLNATYSGTWLTDAKRRFSKPGCVAQKLSQHCLSGKPKRQDLLQTALKWINGDNIRDYMARHQRSKNADELWLHFKSVIAWVDSCFTVQRPTHMKKVDWGELYKTYRSVSVDPVAIESKVKRLMVDDDVKKKHGIYSYIFSGDERDLDLRTFTPAQKTKAYELQNGVCPRCNKSFQFEQMEGDHIDPWSEGGKTVDDNCQMLCKKCNRRKGAN